MRTTLSIADDVLQAVRDRARGQGRTLGEVISDLARHSLNSIPPANLEAEALLPTFGFRPFPSRGAVVTNGLIDKLREDGIY